MNRIRQIRQAIATLGRRPPGKEGATKKRTVTRVGVAMAALAIPLIGGLASATSASAGILPPLGLTLSSNSYDAWVASGSSYTPGLSDVQLWVQDVTNGSWTTLEHQSGLDTTSRIVDCNRYGCELYPGGPSPRKALVTTCRQYLDLTVFPGTGRLYTRFSAVTATRRSQTMQATAWYTATS